jgi:hypothetical protein
MAKSQSFTDVLGYKDTAQAHIRFNSLLVFKIIQFAPERKY